MKKLMSIAIVLVTICAMMIPVFASASAYPEEPMWVNCSNGLRLNLRTRPSTKSDLIIRLENGTKVTLLSWPENGWVKITDGKNSGYVMTKYLVSKQPGKYEITERPDNFKAVTPYIAYAKALNRNTDRSVGLRVNPNKTAQAIRRLAAGDRVQVIARGKVWSKVVDLQTGRTGYVANDYLTA